MCFTREGSSLTCKHYARLERLARDKHFGLLRKSVNYGRNKFYDTVPWSTIIVQRETFPPIGMVIADAKTFSITTFNIMTLRMTLRMTLSMTLSITLSLKG
jgi:hypothetical protein